MKADEFYSSLKDYDTLFEGFGFNRKTKGVCLSHNNIQLHVILDKWGRDIKELR